MDRPQSLPSWEPLPSFVPSPNRSPFQDSYETGKHWSPGWRLGRTQPLSYLEGTAHLLGRLEFIHGEHTHRCEERREPAEPQEGECESRV